jgi:predicted acylesterase/phospholipase RssA
VHIRPDIEHIGTFEFDRMDEAIAAGEEATRKAVAGGGG